jgi:hypothetical protein
VPRIRDLPAQYVCGGCWRCRVSGALLGLVATAQFLPALLLLAPYGGLSPTGPGPTGGSAARPVSEPG